MGRPYFMLGVEVELPVVIVGIVVSLASLAYSPLKSVPPENVGEVYTV